MGAGVGLYPAQHMCRGGALFRPCAGATWSLHMPSSQEEAAVPVCQSCSASLPGKFPNCAIVPLYFSLNRVIPHISTMTTPAHHSSTDPPPADTTPTPTVDPPPRTDPPVTDPTAPTGAASYGLSAMDVQRIAGAVMSLLKSPGASPLAVGSTSSPTTPDATGMLW